MTLLDQSTVTKLLDSYCEVVDGKVASTKTFAKAQFDDFAIWSSWGQSANNATQITDRTHAYLLAYAMISGGVIPLKGLKLRDAWFRPDKWVIGALVKFGLMEVSEKLSVIRVTSSGWVEIIKLLAKV